MWPTRNASPPVALTLISANYVTGASFTLVFDRPIDISAIDGTAIFVDDGQTTHQRFNGTGGAVLVAPTAVRFTPYRVTSATGTGTTLTATASTGIVAVNDGGTWAGATALALPFP